MSDRFTELVVLVVLLMVVRKVLRVLIWRHKEF